MSSASIATTPPNRIVTVFSSSNGHGSAGTGASVMPGSPAGLGRPSFGFNVASRATHLRAQSAHAAGTLRKFGLAPPRRPYALWSQRHHEYEGRAEQQNSVIREHSKPLG